MKQWKGLLAAAFAGALFFTSCKKDNATMTTETATPAPTNAGRPITADVGSIVSYRITTEPSQQNAMFYWNQGSISAITMLLDATHINGNALRLVSYPKVVPVNAHRLYTPVELGAINLPFGKYMAFKFSVKLNSMNSFPAMMLSGSYNTTGLTAIAQAGGKTNFTQEGERVPMQLIINEPIELKGEHRPAMLFNQQDYYSVTFHLDPNRLLDGVTKEMMARAFRRNGTIVISADTNPEIYKYAILNLSKMVMVRLEFKDPLPSR